MEKKRPKFSLVFFVLFLCFFSSCSFFNSILGLKDKDDGIKIKRYIPISSKDYYEHLNFFVDQFLKNKNITFFSPDERIVSYLNELYKILQQNNKAFLPYVKPRFYFVESDLPFHFSFPKGKIFFSTGLLRKFVRYEGDLLAILTFEMIRSLKKVYIPRRVVPVGPPSLQQVIFMGEIPIKYKLRINRWVYYVLKRANFDPYFYLNWLQTKSKNSGYFNAFKWDGNFLPLEEFQYKSFYIQHISVQYASELRENSTSEFYHFIQFFHNRK